MVFAHSHFSTLRMKSIWLVRLLLQISLNTVFFQEAVLPWKPAKELFSCTFLPRQARPAPCFSMCLPSQRFDPGSELLPPQAPARLPLPHRAVAAPTSPQWKEESQKDTEKEKKGRKSNLDPRCRVWPPLFNSWKSAARLRNNRQHRTIPNCSQRSCVYFLFYPIIQRSPHKADDKHKLFPVQPHITYANLTVIGKCAANQCNVTLILHGRSLYPAAQYCSIS